jgi:hypothetical protein
MCKSADVRPMVEQVAFALLALDARVLRRATAASAQPDSWSADVPWPRMQPIPTRSFLSVGSNSRRDTMLWTDIQKDWKNISKKFSTKWNKLQDADLKAIAGKRDELVKHLVKLYKSDKAKMEKEVDDFIKTIKPMKV